MIRALKQQFASLGELSQRAREIFDAHMEQLHRRIDHMFVVLMFCQWAFAVGCAVWLSPYAWDGAHQEVHPHVWLATLMGGLLTLPAAYAGVKFPGRRATRYTIAICQVSFSSLLIHVTGGRIETHFHVFGSLAFLAAYRDWTVLIPATVVVAADHFLRGVFWPETVFGVATPNNWRWLEHAGWVLFEDLWLVICCRQSIHEVQNIASNSARLEESHGALTKQAVALEEVLQQREAIVSGALDAIIQIDENRCISGWNAQACEVFGWSAAETLGQSLVATIAPVTNEVNWTDSLSHYLTTGIAEVLNRRVEVIAARRDGSVFPAELAITAVKSGGRSSLCAFVRDISDRRQAEERLQRAKDNAEEASQAKSLFLANMSHEIRTPLNAILGFTDLIRTSDALSKREADSHLATIHSSGMHLLTVINDILDLSKIEAGQMQYERIRFSPHHIIVEVLSLLRVRAAENSIRLDAKWLGRVPETIESDPARLRQLLLNLVGNAIKFTERGSVQVLARVNPAEQLLQIEVIDTGVGIPADKLELIFSPFTQADTSVTRRFGGTGLGLSICRYIVEALGGTISAQSCVGVGSSFTVTLDTGPLDDVKMLDSVPSEVLQSLHVIGADAPRRLAGLRVLVTDDGETNRRLLQLLLTRAGATVDVAQHGRAAVEQVAQQTFDVILMDVQMPVLDGYSAARELRFRGCTTPIIALTAHAMSGEKERCLAAGCDGFLTKPVRQEELIHELSRLRELPVEVGVLHDFQNNATTVTPENSELDLSDPQIMEIVSEFVGRLDGHCNRLELLLEQQEYESLADQLHFLKGTAAMMGFPKLADSVRALEQLLAEHRESQYVEACAAIKARAQCVTAK